MVRAGLFVAGVALAFAFSMPARAEEVGCVTTAWKMLGANHRVCVEAFDDPKVPGVACHLSQARTGGVSGLDDLVAHRVDGVQRGHRLLEDAGPPPAHPDRWQVWTGRPGRRVRDEPREVGGGRWV